MSTTLKPRATHLLVVALIAALAGASPAYARQSAAEPEAARAAEARALAARAAANEARAESAERHIEALRAAEAEQRAALEAVEAARVELLQQAEIKRQRAAESQEEVREQSRTLAEQREMEARELSEVKRELERAHANLRRASQEVAQVHRELHRADTSTEFEFRISGSRAVIGVVLGDNTAEGVRILGVSPDGPAERIGLQPGDVIVSLMGERLNEGGADGRRVLSKAMEAVEPGDELIITYQRGGELIEATLTAEERIPFSWQSVTRLASAPPAPPAPPAPGVRGVPAAPGVPGVPGSPLPPLIIQPIDGSPMAIEELQRDLQTLGDEFRQRHYIIERIESDDGTQATVEARFFSPDHLSQVGDAALTGTSIWFGVPLTRGLKLAELGPELGAYFQADEGVLVLSATPDNALELRPGDVILSVAGSTVQRPGDVMRALRRVDTGEVIALLVKRQGQELTIDLEIPDHVLETSLESGLPVSDVASWEFRIETESEDSGTP